MDTPVTAPRSEVFGESPDALRKRGRAEVGEFADTAAPLFRPRLADKLAFFIHERAGKLMR
jgi:hypothetical protein